MVTETYLTAEQTQRTFIIIHSLPLYTRLCLRDMGIKWVYERDQYIVVDEKKWLMAKLKYGL